MEMCFILNRRMDNSQLINQTAGIVATAPSNQDVVVTGAANIASTSHVAAAGDSFFGYFWNAGFMIKIVMLSLLISSIWSWAILISKYFKLKKLNYEANVFEDGFWSGMPLDALYKELKDSAFDPMSNIFCAAMAEWERFASRQGGGSSGDNSLTQSLEKRIERAMQIAIKKEIDELEKGMGFLSSLGSNGVIAGLFGTVLGILNGFKSIAAQQNASLATVGPIISEALITTALGIVAAIPAAVGYNKLMNDINRYINRLETFSDEFGSIISRQFDER